MKALGAEVRLGDTSDLDGLREAAASADAVIHLAFNHDVMAAGDMAGATAMDMATVQALGDALAGTGKTFIGIGLENVVGRRPGRQRPTTFHRPDVSSQESCGGAAE